MYRVRKSWVDTASQVGAYIELENAKRMADASPDTYVFNEQGVIIYPINYLEQAAEAAGRTYKAVITYHCKHKGGSKKFSDLASKKVITCSAAMSIVLQLAGCLPEGKLVSHTKATGLNGTALTKQKNTVGKSMTGSAYLTHCDVVRVDKLFKELPKEYQAAGVCYVYDSNNAVSAGGGKIYSCNNSSRQLDGKKQYKMNLMSDGYCFTHRILYCIVPKERG